jgi:selenide,water dikinase
VGTDTSDDAAVYQLDEQTAIIQTLDFFPPVVDDPYTFGQIAAANSLSDIYAMGGEPKLALNIVCFPGCLDPEILGEILSGGEAKIREAGALLAGGHSVQDEEPKYGLSVTGFVNPGKLWTNCGAKAGDAVILTKPLGSGILNTAVKGGIATEAETLQVNAVMAQLNKYAKEAAEEVTVHGCTDITGFGLAGHALELSQGSGVTLHLYSRKLPLLEGAVEYAKMGLVPEGAYRNRQYMEGKVSMEGVPEYLQDIFMDPQTSGGLLLCVPRKDESALLAGLKRRKLQCACIGYAEKRQEYPVILE